MDAHFMSPEEYGSFMAEPAEPHVGTWTCGCGCTKVGPITGPAAVSARAKCPYCGEVAEILPLPKEAS